jgi:transcription antitermination factor NusG
VTEKPWFAIKVNTRYEFRTSAEMTLRGFEPFLPLRRVKRRWSDRVKVIEEPLFPGYIFGRFDLSEKVQILRCAGVSHIVGLGRTPVPVGDEEIGAIKALVESKVMLHPYPYVEAGQKVRIEFGPLAGVEGTVVRADNGKSRLVVSVTLLHRSVAAEIDRDWIKLAG